MECSRDTINKDDRSKAKKKNDPMAQIFTLVRNTCKHAKDSSVLYNEIER